MKNLKKHLILLLLVSIFSCATIKNKAKRIEQVMAQNEYTLVTKEKLETNKESLKNNHFVYSNTNNDTINIILTEYKSDEEANGVAANKYFASLHKKYETLNNWSGTIGKYKLIVFSKNKSLNLEKIDLELSNAIEED